MTHIVAPFGFYGSGNIGDEATLQGFAQLLRQHSAPLEVWIASQSPRHTARIEPAFRYFQYEGGICKTWPRLFAHLARAYVFPGGTPVMDGLGDWPLCELGPIIDHARRWRKPTVFIGSGTEALTRPQSRQIFSNIAGYVAHWSVRSMRDRDRLMGYGVDGGRITVAADMAWLLPSATEEIGRRILQQHRLHGRRIVGVNVNAEQALVEREPELLARLADVCDGVAEKHAAHVLFLCNEIRDGDTFDRAAAERVRSYMRRRSDSSILPNEYRSPPEMMSIIACCAATVTTRYHFGVFSALQGVPFVAIARSDKVADLCEDLNWPFAFKPGFVDATALSRQLDALITRQDDPAGHLAAGVAAMRERALRNRAALDATVELTRDISPIHSLRVLVDRRLPLTWPKQ